MVALLGVRRSALTAVVAASATRVTGPPVT